jgi:hypothetical protein
VMRNEGTSLSSREQTGQRHKKGVS